MLTSKSGGKFEALEDFSLSRPYKAPEPKKRVKPEGKLSDMNIEQELFEAYHAARSLRDTLLDELTPEDEFDSSSGTTPANQIAQVMNTVTTILKDITKMQTEMYNSNRVKVLENCLLAAIKGAPDDVQSKFFAEYESLLKKTDKD